MPMKKKSEFKNADDLISKMDKVIEDMSKLFEEIGFFLEKMKEEWQMQSRHSDMLCLAHCEDRKIALEAFNKLDAERREGIVGALRSSIEDLEGELDRRSRGIAPEPDSQLADSSDEDIRRLLENRYRFANELGINDR